MSSVKPELSSVYFYTNDDVYLVFVSTDSFRTCRKRYKQESSDY